MRRFFIQVFFCLTFSSVVFAQTDSSAITQFVSSPEFKHALVGVCVKDMSGNTLYAYNQDKLLVPASTMKVVTTATAMEVLGDDFRYKTTLSYSEADSTLVVNGAGDPTLGSEYAEDGGKDFLSKWSSEIKDQRFSKTPIHLLVDDSLFGYDGISAQWTWEDIGNYYACGAYGISFLDNTYRIHFNTLRTDTAAVISEIEPNIPGLTFQNNVQLNSTGQDNGFIHGIPFSLTRFITGNIPAGRSDFSIKGDIPDPGFYLAKSLTDEIRFDGLTVLDYTTVRRRPLKNDAAKVFYTHQSSELKDIVRQINVRSNNHYAEHLIRTIGVYENGSASSQALKLGIGKIHSYWGSQGLDTSALLMYDGCGLSPADGVAPEFMVDLLVKMKNGKNAKPFYESLPKVGEEGTVRNLLKDTRLVGKIRAKSGSIADVQCFAGYFVDGDKKYAFSIMVNKYDGPRKSVVKDIEKLLLAMF